jgi:hypothetical protein
MNTTVAADYELNNLPVPERIVRTTSSKLIKHFRGLESAGIIDRETAANLIGCVKKLSSVARGEASE